jgi:hypothetical protein
MAMSIWLRRAGALALAGLVGLGASSEAWARFAIAPNRAAVLIPPVPRQAVPFPGLNPNYFLAPGLTVRQAAYNTVVLGRALANVPPYALGYNPYVRAVNFGGTIIPPAPVVPPVPTLPATITATPAYGLSTVPTAFPAVSSGYGLSTMPGCGGGSSLSTDPFGNLDSGYGGCPPSFGDFSYGGYLRGAADLTSATGRYWVNIQQARLLREQSRQLAIDTARKRRALADELERMRPMAQDVRDREMATDLTRARRDPPMTEIFSGRALNDLLRSINASGQLSRGPHITLEEDTLEGINLAVPASRGNVGMLKKDKLDWPLALQGAQFDEMRNKLSTKLAVAVAELKGNDLQPSTIKDVRAYHKALTEKLDRSVRDLSPAQFIRAKRFLNQLGEAVKALSEPKAATFFNNTGTAKGKNVAELVDHLKKEGLQFAPAAPGDERAYLALYQALRAFEAPLQVARTQAASPGGQMAQ